jgi:peptidoglycan/LPS O-acetylase OafA/YrhL
MCFVILLSFGKNSLLSTILTNRVLMRVGILSYSLYIWQEFFIGTFVWQPWFKFLQAWPIGELITLKLVSVFLIAYLSYTFIESTFLKWRFKLQSVKTN